MLPGGFCPCPSRDSSDSIRRSSSSCSSRALAAIALTASNSSRLTRSMPASTRSSWSRSRASTSPRTPESAPTAPAATRAMSSKIRFWLCIARLRVPGRAPNRRGELFRRAFPRLCRPPSGMAVDLGLHRGTGLADEIYMVLRRKIVTVPQRFAAPLEMRMHITGHQLEMPPGLLPIRPVMGELADDAEPARAGHQPLDIGDRVVGRADAGGAALDHEGIGVGDIGRHDREGRHIAEIVGKGGEAELDVLLRLLARLGDVHQPDEAPFAAVWYVAVAARFFFIKLPIGLVAGQRIGAGPADRQHADAVFAGGEAARRRARGGDRQLHRRLAV